MRIDFTAILFRLSLIGMLVFGAPRAWSGLELDFCVEDRDVRPWRSTEGKGLNYELLDRVAVRLGMTFRYRMMPWKRCLDELKSNRVHGTVGASFKEERLAIGAYPGGRQADARKRLNLDRYVVLRRKNSAVDWDGRRFKGLSGPVAAQLGYSVVDDLKAIGVPVDEGAPGALETARKLLAGHVNAAAMLEGEAKSLLAGDSRMSAELEILPAALAEKPYYLMLSRQLAEREPMLAERIWKTIEKVRLSPDYRVLEEGVRH